MRSTFFLCAVSLSGLLVALIAGCQEQNSVAQNHVAASAGNDTVAVKVVSPQRITLCRKTTQPATIEAQHVAELHAKVAGYLTELKVDIGESVEADDVLAVIGLPEMVKAREKQEAIVRRLQADEKRAKASIALAAANVTAAEASRDQAKADIIMTDAQLTAGQAEFDRFEDLVSNKAVAGRLLDETRMKLQSSQAAKLAVQAAFESAKANVLVAQQELAVAEADWESAQTQTEVARKDVEETDAMMAYATLRAPFAGVVIERNVDPGDLVRNTQTASDSPRRPLFAIAQLDTVRACVMIPESETPWASEGDPMTLVMRAMPNREFEGKINRTAGSLDESTRTMLVEVDLPNPDRVLLPGMYGQATIMLEEKADCLVLPAGAVRYDAEGRSYVFVVGEDNTVSVVDVSTGLDDGHTIEITEGLSGNERVADAMRARLKPGQQVRVQDE